mmetsp:Transcript_43129/g.111375  ORF Transcript_43129/g.111375 Transcript_43129/m.111375 type:complete len:488 (+) Transcript_43129:110-1573(+)
MAPPSAQSTAANAVTAASTGQTRGQRALRALGGGWFFFLAIFGLAAGTAKGLLLQVLSMRDDARDSQQLAFFMVLGDFAGCCLIAVACGGRLSLQGALQAQGNKEAPSSGDAEAPSSGDAEVSKADGARQGKGWAVAQWLRIILLGLLLCACKGLPLLASLWLQFPIVVLITSMTLIPTMMVAQLVGNSRRFSHTEYTSATIFCLGIAGASVKSEYMAVPAGLVCLGFWLLLASVLANVVNVNVRQELMQKHGASPMSLLLCQNFVGLWLSVAGVCATTDLPAMVESVNRVELFFALAIVAANAATAWAFINLIKEAGAVQQVGLETLRQLVAVALSYALFPDASAFQAILPVGFFAAVGGLTLGCAAPAPPQPRVRGWQHHRKHPNNQAAAVHAVASRLSEAESVVQHEDFLFQRTFSERVAMEIINIFAGSEDDDVALSPMREAEEESEEEEAGACDEQPPCDLEAHDLEQCSREAPVVVTPVTV